MEILINFSIFKFHKRKEKQPEKEPNLTKYIKK